jgi:hypothetical protein
MAYNRENYLKTRDKRISRHKYRYENDSNYRENMLNRSKVWHALPENLIKKRNSRYHTNFFILKEKQDNKCAICGEPFLQDSSAFIDHDHSCCESQNRSCGKCVRGLLCKRDNDRLALYKDNIQLLQKTIEYLEGFNDDIK